MTLRAAAAAPKNEHMITLPPMDAARMQIAIVRPAAAVERPLYFALSDRGLRTRMLLNKLDKREHKSAESVIFFNDMLTAGMEMEKVAELYVKLGNECEADINTFFEAYLRMTDEMKKVVPNGCVAVTDVSEEDGCLYNYYEFGDTKMFFNLFFDCEDEECVTAVANVNKGGKFHSIQGKIEEVKARVAALIHG